MNASNYNCPSIQPGITSMRALAPDVAVREVKSKDAEGKPCILTHIVTKPKPFRRDEPLWWRNRYAEKKLVFFVYDDITNPEMAWVTLDGKMQLVYLDSLTRPV